MRLTFRQGISGGPPAEDIVTQGQKLILAVVSLALLASLAAFHLEAAQRRPFDHDEQLQVTGGALLARQGLLPYRDYPCEHLPYLAPVLALIYDHTDNLLASARTFNAACGVALVALVYALTWAALKEMPFWLRLMVSAATAVYMTMNAMFVFSSGRADNHDASLLLAVGAFLAHVLGMRRRQKAWYLLSGVLLGLATGVRLTMLPLAGAMVLAVLLPLERRPAGEKAGGTGLFLAGLAVGLLPAMVFTGMDPQRALFYNYTFNADYNGAFWLDQGGGHPVSIPAKLGYLLGEVTWVPSHYPYIRYLGSGWATLPLLPFAQNGGLFLGLALMVYFGRTLLSGPLPQVRRLTLWALPFALAAALASTPAFYQYFYPLLPFCLILFGCGWGALWRAYAPRPRMRKVLTRSLAGFSLAFLLLGYGGMAIMVSHWAGQPGPAPAWVSHLRGREMRSLLPGGGKVLTLSPVFPLEGGLEIYPQLVTGPFFWRVAHLIEPERRKALNIVGPGDLESWLAGDPPAAILIGFEGDQEEALKDYARRHGYRPRPLMHGGLLYLPGAIP